MTSKKGLLERLKNGERVICAEGYVFEFERRGYLKAGAFVPEIVLERPDLVRQLHEEFVHAGSDVVEAFTYYAHRAKLRIIGREGDLEKMNREALKIARGVADETNTLMAGNICNTNVYVPGDEEAKKEIIAMFKEQVEWAVQEGADFIVGETFNNFGEAMLALECIKQYGKDLPAVVTMMPGGKDVTYDGYPFPDVCRLLEEAGAAVVGLNCCRGPESMFPLIKDVRKVCKGPIACLPVPFRTDTKRKAMQLLQNDKTGARSFPLDMDQWLCSRSQIKNLTEELLKLDVQYMGLCCGNMSHYTRVMAETLGRRPPGSKYSPDIGQHLSEVQGEVYNYTKEKWREDLKLPVD